MPGIGKQEPLEHTLTHAIAGREDEGLGSMGGPFGHLINEGKTLVMTEFEIT